MNEINKKVDVNPKDIDLKKLRGLMKRGDNKQVAKETGYSSVYVSSVLNPNKPDVVNADIIKAAVNLVQGRLIKMDSSFAKVLTKNGKVGS